MVDAIASPFDASFAATFVREEIAPDAARWDQEERLPQDLPRRLGEAGILAPLVPRRYGGSGANARLFGRMNEEVGAVCASTRSLVTVQSMVAEALLRWGTDEQRREWLPPLCRGSVVAGFALTEPAAGSDASAVATRARVSRGDFVLDGYKRWTSFGQIADVFLVVARSAEGACTFLVDGDSPGLTRTARGDLLGARASMLADLALDGVRVPARNLVGPRGMALASTVATALDLGRLSIAWGCVGMGRALVDASVRHAVKRHQFGVPIGDHQLVRRLITHMATDVEAARLLCERASSMKDVGDPESVTATLQAKLYASTVASRVAGHAVQIHGAIGCCTDSEVARHLRDAQVMEVIEGTTQVLEAVIGEHLLARCAT